MRFWDTSAFIPLLIDEPQSAAMEALMAADMASAVWWLTPLECWSALARLQRERRLDEAGMVAAGHMLAEASRSWTEVPPIARVRDQAARLVRVHPLRMADALQLAAALVLSDFEPATLPFVTLDDRLAAAARREGFEVFGV